MRARVTHFVQFICVCVWVGGRGCVCARAGAHARVCVCDPTLNSGVKGESSDE